MSDAQLQPATTLGWDTSLLVGLLPASLVRRACEGRGGTPEELLQCVDDAFVGMNTQVFAVAEEEPVNKAAAAAAAALAAAQASIAKDAPKAAAHQQRGNAFVRKGAKSRKANVAARAAYSEALLYCGEAAVRAVLHSNRSLVRLRLGDAAGALADAREGVALDPGYEKAPKRLEKALAAMKSSVEEIDDEEEEAAAAPEEGGGAVKWAEGRGARDSGRCMLAAEGADIVAGCSVLGQAPAAAALRPEAWRTHCHWCLRAVVSGAPFCCGGCAHVQYCGAACRAAAAEEHGAECGRAEFALLPPTTVCAMRLNRKSKGDKTAAGLELRRALAPMATHGDELDGFELLGHCVQAAAACRLPPALLESEKMEPADALRLCLLTQFNAVALGGVGIAIDNRDGGGQVEEVEQQSHAVALYTRVALANHCCEPSALLRFRGRDAELVALRGLSGGEEISLSYGPTVGRQARPERRQVLQRRWCFECRCVACSRPDSTQVDLERMRCRAEASMLDQAARQAVVGGDWGAAGEKAEAR